MLMGDAGHVTLIHGSPSLVRLSKHRKVFSDFIVITDSPVQKRKSSPFEEDRCIKYRIRIRINILSETSFFRPCDGPMSEICETNYSAHLFIVVRTIAPTCPHNFNTGTYRIA